MNHERHQREALYYINRLNVPDGYTVEALTVREAHGMAAGYNEAMTASDAKYKVYLHQDVFIVNKNFISDLLDIFREEDIGMAGMVGVPQLPENSIMWNAPRIGKIYAYLIYQSSNSVFGGIGGRYQQVQAVDGLLIATQYDLPWREDLFDNWDFYDISQGQEFIQKGYRIVVPYQKQPWCIHDDGFNNLKNYYHARRIFQKEYRTI